MSTSNLSNFSSSEKDLDCGALYEPYVFKLSLIVVYCMVLLVGLTGNALIITLVYKRKDLRKTINQLIANMTFSDFVFQLTSIPVELAKQGMVNGRLLNRPDQSSARSRVLLFMSRSMFLYEA